MAKDIPCYRTNILLDIYKRYFTPGGKLKALIMGNGDLTEELIDEYAEKHTFNADEIDDITLLVLKWMYEEGVLGQG